MKKQYKIILSLFFVFFIIINCTAQNNFKFKYSEKTYLSYVNNNNIYAKTDFFIRNDSLIIKESLYLPNFSDSSVKVTKKLVSKDDKDSLYELIKKGVNQNKFNILTKTITGFNFDSTLTKYKITTGINGNDYYLMLNIDSKYGFNNFTKKEKDKLLKKQKYIDEILYLLKDMTRKKVLENKLKINTISSLDDFKKIEIEQINIDKENRKEEIFIKINKNGIIQKEYISNNQKINLTDTVNTEWLINELILLVNNEKITLTDAPYFVEIPEPEYKSGYIVIYMVDNDLEWKNGVYYFKWYYKKEKYKTKIHKSTFQFINKIIKI